MDWKSLLSRLILALSTVAVVLGVCEFALRYYMALVEDTKKIVYNEPAKLMRTEERTGWLPKEGARVEMRDANGASYVFRVNSESSQQNNHRDSHRLTNKITSKLTQTLMIVVR